jgi:hypothetical protein
LTTGFDTRSAVDVVSWLFAGVPVVEGAVGVDVAGLVSVSVAGALEIPPSVAVIVICPALVELLIAAV